MGADRRDAQVAGRHRHAGPANDPTEQWAGFFTCENIAGWRWRMKTSKSKYRAAQDFDLTRYRLLLPLLDAVPPHERTGAIIKGKRALPIRARSYYNWFNDIAEPAGIPAEVWNMDARAGRATEGEETGATVKMIQGASPTARKAPRCATSAPVGEGHRRRRGSPRGQARIRKRRRNNVRTACQNHVRIAGRKFRGINQLIGRSERI